MFYTVQNDTALSCIDTDHLSIRRPLSRGSMNSSVQPSFETAMGTITTIRTWPTTQQVFGSDVAELRIFTLSSDKSTKSTACSGNFWSSSRSVVFETRYLALLNRQFSGFMFP